MAESLFGKFKMLIGVEDMEREDDIESAASMSSVQTITEGSAVRRTSYNPKNDYYNRPVVETHENKVVRMQNNHISKNPQVKLIVVEPKDFNECPKLVDSIKNNRPVILNLEALDIEMARRIFDFLSGAVYALGGCMRKVANNIFVIAPENVDVLAEETEKTSVTKSNSGNLWRK